MDWMDDLRHIAQPPAEMREIPAAEWTLVESALKTALPADYKAFVETWGPSYIGMFFHVFAPADGNAGIVGKAERVSQALSTLKAHHPDRYTAPVFPENGGFLAWGWTDNGDYLGWMTTSRNPDDWPVAVWGEEDGAPQVFDDLAFGAFLVGVVTGEVRPEPFPDIWDSVPLTITAPVNSQQEGGG